MKTVRALVAGLLCIAISLAIVLNSGTLAWRWRPFQAEVYDWGTATQGRRVTRKQALSVSHKILNYCSLLVVLSSRCVDLDVSESTVVLSM